MERYFPIIDDLYTGTLDNAAWERALLGIADVVSASAAMLLTFNPSSGAVYAKRATG